MSESASGTADEYLLYAVQVRNINEYTHRIAYSWRVRAGEEACRYRRHWFPLLGTQSLLHVAKPSQHKCINTCIGKENSQQVAAEWKL